MNSRTMDWYVLLRFFHIVSFATWFGTVFASLFLLKTLEPKLTDSTGNPEEYAKILRSYIKRETKVADAAFKLTIASGLLMALLTQTWSIPLFVKIALVILQFALTMGYIVKAIQPLTYPCSPSDYKRWYNLFAISLSMFALVLSVSFFLL